MKFRTNVLGAWMINPADCSDSLNLCEISQHLLLVLTGLSWNLMQTFRMNCANFGDPSTRLDLTKLNLTQLIST